MREDQRLWQCTACTTDTAAHARLSNSPSNSSLLPENLLAGFSDDEYMSAWQCNGYRREKGTLQIKSKQWTISANIFFQVLECLYKFCLHNWSSHSFYEGPNLLQSNDGTLVWSCIMKTMLIFILSCTRADKGSTKHKDAQKLYAGSFIET